MNKEELLICIEDGMSLNKIADKYNVCQSTVRYWLNKFSLKTKNKSFIQSKQLFYKCKCGETDPNYFYGNKKQICSKCQNKYNTLKARQNKIQGVEYLGGKCKKCGFDKYMSALDFHHINELEKDIKFKSSRQWSWNKLRQELDKCILLCSNCHRGVHSGDIIL